MDKTKDSVRPEPKLLVEPEEEKNRMNVTRVTFEWKIEDFLLRQNTERLESKTFTVGPESQYRFRFKLYNGTFSESTKDYVSLFLQLISPIPFRGFLMIYVLNNRGEKVEIRQSEGMVTLTRKFKWGFRAYLRHSQLMSPREGLLTRDALRIFCQANCDEFYRPMEPSPPTEEQLARYDVLCQYEKMLSTGDFSDVKFKSGDGKVLLAHRSILAACSPVFFKGLQNVQGDVTINLTKYNVEVIKEMLRFVYLGTVDHMDEYAKELLQVAHVYRLEGLREMCAKSLCKSISSSNAFEYLRLGHKLKAPTLKARAMAFLSKNGRYLMDRPEVKGIATLESGPLNDVIRVMMRD